MATTSSMTGVISVNATSPTEVLLSNLGPPNTVTLTVTATDTTAKSSYTVNAETQLFSASGNSYVLANGVANIIRNSGAGSIGTLTLCAAATGQTYTIAKPLY
jgi:hypothetical protein